MVIHHPELVNLYGCELGEETQVGPFVEIQKGVRVGRRCKISSHSFLCEGVTLEDEVFIGHGVIFINDRYPRAVTPEWKLEPAHLGQGASIGSGAVILCGVTIETRAPSGLERWSPMTCRKARRWPGFRRACCDEVAQHPGS